MDKPTPQEKLRRTFAISFICGFCIALYGISIKASEKNLSQNMSQPTITIDVKNLQQSVNDQEVEKFNAAQNPKQIKFAMNQDGKIILSDQKIILPTPYKPARLADLGLRLTRHAKIVKLPGFEIAVNNAKRTPVIPPMLMLPKPQPVAAIAAAPAKATQTVTLTQKISAMQPAVLSFVLWLITAISTMTVLTLLLSSRERKHAAGTYTGKLGEPTDLVGDGKMFGFSTKDINGRLTNVNSTTLNMLWHLGRLSNENNVDTYFYMAFYIPPHQQYAAVLKRAKEKKETTS